MKIAAFLILMLVCTISCAVIWGDFVDGKLYNCTDSIPFGFLHPGDWVHSHNGISVAVVTKITPTDPMEKPDSIEEGWSVPKLWLLWWSFVVASVVISASSAFLFFRYWKSKSEQAIVRDVTKKFGARTVVNHIAMQVRPGEIYGFLGPNGSGKTTFLRMLCGLLKPDGGEGSCLGYDFRTQSAEIKKHVGYMTQKFSFYEDLSIEENLDFIARLYEIPQRAAAVEKKPRTSRHGGAPQTARRHAFRRLETTARVVRVPDPRTATAPAR